MTAAPAGGLDVLAVMQASADQLWRYRRDILAREEEEARAAVAELIEAARKAHIHIASIGYPANARGLYDKDGEWTFAEAIPREVNAAEIKAAFLTLDAALAKVAGNGDTK